MLVLMIECYCTCTHNYLCK